MTAFGRPFVETAALGSLQDKYWEAVRLAKQGDHQEAEQSFRRLIALATGPMLAKTHNDLAVLAEIDGRIDEAERYWRLALDADPNCSVAHENLRRVATRRGTLTIPEPSHSPRRVVIVSLLFNWPSAGGGNVHTVELALALQQAGYEVKHVCARFEPWRIGKVDASCPIRSEVLEFTAGDWQRERILERYRQCVDAWQPDVVIVTDSWSMKPHLAQAVSAFPFLLRFDALECLCPLNNLRQLPHSPAEIRMCTRHRLATQQHCMTCVEVLGDRSSPLHQLERVLSDYASSSYHDLLAHMLQRADAVLVFNPLIAAHLEPYCRSVRVVPAGVDAARFAPYDERQPTMAPRLTRILFAGRLADPVKGFYVLREAAARLWSERHDFRIVATGRSSTIEEPFLEYCGWRPHHELPGIYQDCDIVAVPATADEPFGITAIEGMAAARPVVVSRVGGLQFTVLDEITGLQFEPANPADLARQLSRLLDAPAWRVTLGAAGRERVLERFDWPAVVRRDYHPLLCRNATLSC